MNKKRYVLLDSIRGFTLLNMILYHAIWDLVYLFHLDWTWYLSPAAYFWQQSICCTFILVSGFCYPLGHHPLKRGSFVFFAGAMITLVTLNFTPESPVVFGVLTLLGSCTLLMVPLEKILKKSRPLSGLLLSMFLFLLTKNMHAGFVGIGSLNLFRLPESLYANLFTTYLGFPTAAFFSTDYFPLIPWCFLFFSGYYLYHLAARQNWLYFLTLKRNRPLEWLGRHSLLIYLFHQPILYFCLALIL